MLEDTAATSSVHWSWMAILSDPIRLAILAALLQLGSATIPELRRLCHTSDPTLRRHLTALEALDLVHERPAERDGLTPGRPPSSYVLRVDAATRVGALLELVREPLHPG